MKASSQTLHLIAISVVSAFTLTSAGLPGEASAKQEAQATGQTAATKKPHLDHSGRKRVGKASFYANKFAGREMANGERMDPQGSNAASTVSALRYRVAK